MFESMKERKRQRQEEREQLIREEKNRLLSLSEKELLVEILFELKRIENGHFVNFCVKRNPNR